MADDVRFDANWDDAVLKASRPLMRRAVAEIFGDMLRAVPRDTGELADSGDTQESGDTYRISFGTDHCLPVEFGTRYMAAQPFMRPALYRKRSL
jgi:HK97 gp10 family phage protein